ncbi:Crp/Fnr family transcriptional regulator [Haliangium sp.]|uniref:Crp/Fnr family transcriptional regulator n=1 Tax=Haliangium sp. TaxID=2663208 RepID=UPI003D109C86
MSRDIEQNIQEFPAGTHVFRQEDPGDVMYVIQSGAIEIRRRFYNREFLLAVLTPGEFFGEMAIVTHQPRSATALVREDARLLAIDEKTLSNMLKNQPTISARILHTMARRMEHSNRQMELFLFNHADKRLVHCLCYLAEEHERSEGDNRGAIYVPVALSELADRCAMTRDQAVDVIERLAEAGLLVSASAVDIDGPGYVIAEPTALIDFLKAQQSALRRNQQRRRAALMAQAKSGLSRPTAALETAELGTWLSK